MNEHKVLIYHYSSKNRKWYDATNSVLWYGDNKKAWRVLFVNSKRYFYVSFSNMKIYDSPKRVDFLELYYKNSRCFNVKELLCFNGQIYKIFYENGHTCIAFPSELKIVKDVLKNNKQASEIMAYYHKVVQETIHTKEDQFLLQQFDSIDIVSEESVLALYLNGQLEKRNLKLVHPIISPFGINLSQLKAIEMAFNNRISIIEGPPGTGKTQTILNLIANALINKMSVAVVSNNNSATDNVYEKLDKYGYSFIAATLGNNINIEKFFEEYNTEIPAFEKNKVDITTLKNLYYDLPNCFKNENNKKIVNEKLSAIELEYKHFLLDNKEIDFSKIKVKPEKVKSEDVINTLVFLKESDKKISFFTKLKLRFKFKLNKSFFSNSLDEWVTYFNNLYYLAKISEIKKEIDQLDKRMSNQTLEQKIDMFTKLSKQYFENQLSIIFANNTRSGYRKNNYKREFIEFVKDYPVILSSTYSLAKCTQRGFLFDYLIVDESSQVNMASAILSMRVARNIVVVGDIKQLPQIDDDSFKERNEQLLAKFNIPKTYSYYGNSIMSSLLSLYGDKIPKIMLKEHYRCNKDIISFCNRRFYNNELIIYTKAKKQDYSMKVIKTSAGNYARKNPNGSGLYNQREIDEIKQLLNKEELIDVGVIAPYRYQAQIIMEQIGDKVDASTIHKFQGREKKTIIFSSVINDPNDFVENDNLINVAVSRAIDKFILVTSDKIAKSNSGVLSDLVNYITYNNNFGILEEGTVKSIYDLLYEDYQKELEKFRNEHPSKDFDSENITKELIKNILSESKYLSYDLRMHVSLKDFISLKGLSLTKEEYIFFKNPNSHVDFLIYNKMSRRPVLAIEVDGIYFHEQQKTQQERDIKKNSILEKAGVKLLRLKTNESREEERIRSILDSI